MSAVEGCPAGEAEHRISQAAGNKTRVLDLSGLELTAVPDSIGQLTSLTILDLGDNPLSSPPPEVTAQGTKAIVAFLRAHAS